MKIEKPGVYYDFSEAAYFADPTPEPSLTQSVAKILLEQSPAHAKLAHPRLSTAAEDDEEEKYTKIKAIGNAAHKLMLGRGREIVALDFDNMRSKAAQEQYADAMASNRLPVLVKHLADAHRMVDAARAQLAMSDYPDIFDGGMSEIVLAWQEGPIWCRQMLDWSDDMVTICDYKTSGMCCAPHVIETRASEAGWDVQAAFAERGLDRLEAFNAGRRQFLFIAQEQYAPYGLSIVKISEADLTMGRKKIAMAMDLWARCIRSGTWPIYSAQTIISRPKPWLETKTLEREIAHHESKSNFDPNILMAG